MRKIFYFVVALLLFYCPITVTAASSEPLPISIEISYINVTLEGENINSGVVETSPNQQIKLHVVFNYYGGNITNYPATQLKLDAGNFNGKIQVLPNHFEKVSDTQAAGDVIVSISSTAEIGDVIPVKFIIDGPDISSEEGETITFVIINDSNDTTDTSSSTEPSSSETSSTSDNSDSPNESSSTSVPDSNSSTESHSTSQTDSKSSSGERSNSSVSSSTSESSQSNTCTTATSSNPIGNQKMESDHTGYAKLVSSTGPFINKKDSNSANPMPKFLPKTGMEASSFTWFGFGLISFVGAIYLLHKNQ